MKFLIIFLSTFNHVFSANILVILGLPRYSHQIIHYPILTELLSRGHNLTIFSPILMDYGGHENVTQYEFDRAPDIEVDGTDMLSQKIKETSKLKIWMKHEGNFRLMTAKVQLGNEKLQELFQKPENTHFELIYMECMLCPFVFLAEVYKCPIVMSSASQMGISNHRIIGNTIHPAIHAEIYASSVPHGELKFLDRIFAIISRFFSNSFENNAESTENKIIKEFFPDMKFPPHGEVLNDRLKLFYGFMNEMTTSIRAVTPNFLHTGFIHLKLPKSLISYPDLKQFLDLSENGVIIMSFGSIVKDFNAELFIKFLKAFEELPYNIVWKTGIENFSEIEIPKKIFISKWLPIADILAHPNAKLLIGHSGLRTVEEAVDREIPMILFPLSYDQPFNARHLSDKKIAIELDLNKFSTADLIAAINEIMKKKYKENIHNFRSLVFNQMATSLDNSVEFIEYLIKYNESYKYQNYGGIGVNFFVLHHFDIHFILLILVGGVIFIIKCVVKFLKF